MRKTGLVTIGFVLVCGVALYLAARGDEQSRISGELAVQLSGKVYVDSIVPYADESVRKGSRFSVPGWQWVGVMNPDGVENGNCRFEFCDECGIEYGGRVTVLGINEQGVALVRYRAPRKAFGTSCPTGTIFFIPSFYLSGWGDQLLDRDSIEAEVEKILGRAK